MDIVFVHGLTVECVIGVWDWERRMRQKVVIDLDLAGDVARAAASDDLADTLDYKAVTKRVIAFVEASEFQLVETLAERIAGVVREEFGVPWVRVRLNKRGAVRGARDSGVVIERGTQP